MNWLAVVSVSEAILVLTIVWRGSALLTNLNSTMSRLSTEVTVLNVTRDKHIELLGRIAEKLDAMDKRQNATDRRIDRLEDEKRGAK